MHPLEKHIKDQGLEVIYHHYRFACKVRKDGSLKCTPVPLQKHKIKSSWQILNYGGYTEAIIKDCEGVPISEGIAMCSFTDNFCRATGREIALRRAYQLLQEVIA